MLFYMTTWIIRKLHKSDNDRFNSPENGGEAVSSCLSNLSFIRRKLSEQTENFTDN